MADVFDKKKRSEIMSRIRSKNTKAEKLVFSYLRARGVYFQRHYSKAGGSPDVAFPRKKMAIFIDGDFWHGRDLARVLRDRDEDDYWVKKIRGNVARDRRQRTSLRKSGWKVLRLWESELMRKRTRDNQLKRIERFMGMKK